VTEKLPSTQSRRFYADKIGSALGKSVDGFIEAGRWLIEAKEGENKLPHGEFEKMVADDLHFTRRTAARFMEIARHPVISNGTHVSHLPPSWGTLYELTKVDPKVLESAIKDGRVNPKMERKEVTELLPAKSRKIKPRQADSHRDRIVAFADGGMSSEQIAKEVGLNGRAVRHVIERETARRKAVADAEPEIDVRTLSLSAQKKVELAVRQQAQQIAAEYQRRFADEIKQHLEDTVMPHYREMEKRYHDLSESRTKGIMDRKTFRLIWSCLHTDSRKSVSDEKLNEAFHLFSRMETKLMSEKDDPTPKFKMPTTFEEMMALKQKVSAERKAKRDQHAMARRH